MQGTSIRSATDEHRRGAVDGCAQETLYPSSSRSLDALAEQYDVHPKTLRRRIADGTMSGYLMAGKGRAVFLDQDEVDEKLFRQVPTVERSA